MFWAKDFRCCPPVLLPAFAPALVSPPIVLLVLGLLVALAPGLSLITAPGLIVIHVRLPRLALHLGDPPLGEASATPSVTLGHVQSLLDRIQRDRRSGRDRLCRLEDTLVQRAAEDRLAGERSEAEIRRLAAGLVKHTLPPRPEVFYCVEFIFTIRSSQERVAGWPRTTDFRFWACHPAWFRCPAYQRTGVRTFSCCLP